MAHPITRFSIIVSGLIVVSTTIVIMGYVASGFYEMRMDAKQAPCEELPLREEVERVIAEHKDICEQIENINPGYVLISIDAERCPGKADIIIYYGTKSDRKAIKNLIGDDFFGIPYRMFNV